MKKALNITQSIIESVVASAVMALILLALTMMFSSCGSTKHEAKAKHKWMHDRKSVSVKHNNNRSYTCYEW